MRLQKLLKKSRNLENGKLQRFGYVLFGAGLTLLAEHIINYGYVEWELLGHETYGLILIIISLILLARREGGDGTKGQTKDLYGCHRQSTTPARRGDA